MNYKNKSLSDFKKAHPKEYAYAVSKNFIEDICNEMGWTYKKIIKKSKGFWTKENFIKECQKYNSYKELRQANKSAVECARTTGYLDEVIKLLNWEERKIIGSQTKWTKEKCMESALKYNSKVEWEKGDKKAYSASRTNNWYHECTAHMLNLINKSGYWTKEKCMENALQYTSKEKWKKENYSANGAARKNGWYEECTAHMTQIKNPNGYWTKEKCIEEAKKYNTVSEWKINNQTSYNKAIKNGWLKEIKQLMNW